MCWALLLATVSTWPRIWMEVAAYWASWADALPMIQERHPKVADQIVHRLEGVPVVSKPDRVGAIYRIVQESLWGHAGIRVHGGKPLVEAGSAGARSARTCVFSAGLAARSGQSGGRRVSRGVVPRFVTQPSSVAPVPEWSRSRCSFLCDPFVDACVDRTSLVPGCCSNGAFTFLCLCQIASADVAVHSTLMATIAQLAVGLECWVGGGSHSRVRLRAFAEKGVLG